MKNILISRISLKDKVFFAQNLAIMLKSGLTLSESLDILADQASNRFKKIILRINQMVMSGNSIKAALARHPKVFSPFFINAISAGETSGTLEESLRNISLHINKEKELIDKIRRAMFYPLIVLILGFVIALVIAFVVLPKITPLFKGLKLELPAATRGLIWLANFVENYGGRAFFLLVFGSMIFLWIIKQPWTKPLSHRVLLIFPIIGKISRNRNLAAFCLSLGTLLKSGLNIDESLTISSETVKNYHYRKNILKARDRVNRGNTLADSLSSYTFFFPKMAVSMIKVGEKSGNLVEELYNLSGLYEQEVDNAAKILAVAIEPALLIIIGLIVGGLALAIITPIYMITGGI